MLDRSCPLAQQQLIELYFLEMRARVLDLAAFLDRMDRSVEQNAEDDFRLIALRLALLRLSAYPSGRVHDIQMILSDPTSEPLEELDRKNALGAFDYQGHEE
jgi:hypothetical protein